MVKKISHETEASTDYLKKRTKKDFLQHFVNLSPHTEVAKLTGKILDSLDF